MTGTAAYSANFSVLVFEEEKTERGIHCVYMGYPR